MEHRRRFVCMVLLLLSIIVYVALFYLSRDLYIMHFFGYQLISVDKENRSELKMNQSVDMIKLATISSTSVNTIKVRCYLAA